MKCRDRHRSPRRASDAAVPVLLGDERFDLALAIDDEPQRDALHAPGAQPERELGPHERRHVVADDPIEHAARALRVVEVLVELARVADAVLDAFLRDLVELDPLGRLVGGLQLLGEVPGDGFALAIGVGREQDLVDPFGRRLELLKDLLLSGDDLVGLLEAVLDVDA